MLAIIHPGKPAAVSGYFIDDTIGRLAHAAAAGERLEPAMQAVVTELGFAGFTYATSSDAGPARRDTRWYVWSTLPGDWVAQYDQCGYIEIDPAVTRSWNRSLPLVWDAADCDDPRCGAYLSDARGFGIASGVSISFRDRDHGRIYVALNSPISPVPQERKRAIAQRLGDIVLLAFAFHDCFMACLVDREPAGADPAATGPELSGREKQCLELAAKGMTSADIGIKLGIKARTANFHFRNIVSKLDALNRSEAIALGVARGLIRPDHPAVPLAAGQRRHERGELGGKGGVHAQLATFQRMREGDAARMQKHAS